MNLRSLSILLCLTVIAIGCKSGDTTAADAPATTTGKPAAPAAAPATENTVVGTWTNDDKDMKDTTIEFKSDGTLTLAGTDPSGMKANATATYKMDGNKMTMKVTSLKEIAPDGADEKTKKSVEDANKSLTDEALKKMPEDVSTITWKNKDSFTTTNETGPNKGKVTTFTRKS